MATRKNGVIASKTLTGDTDFEKLHKSKAVADKHARKIRARGGKAVVKKVTGGYKIEYRF